MDDWYNLWKKEEDKLEKNENAHDTPEYAMLRQLGIFSFYILLLLLLIFYYLAKNNYTDLMPDIKQMPLNWPGVGLEHGLSSEHLIPHCQSSIFYFFLFSLSFISLVYHQNPMLGRDDAGWNKGFYFFFQLSHGLILS